MGGGGLSPLPKIVSIDFFWVSTAVLIARNFFETSSWWSFPDGRCSNLFGHVPGCVPDRCDANWRCNALWYFIAAQHIFRGFEQGLLFCIRFPIPPLGKGGHNSGELFLLHFGPCQSPTPSLEPLFEISDTSTSSSPKKSDFQTPKALSREMPENFRKVRIFYRNIERIEVTQKWLKSDSGRPTPKWPKIDSKVTPDPILSHFWVTFESLGLTLGWNPGSHFRVTLGHFSCFCVSVDLGARPLHNPKGKGPKIEKNSRLPSRIEIFKRDWKFQARSPPRPYVCGEFWRSRL